jgi:predicted Rossmann fold flavoprotein
MKKLPDNEPIEVAVIGGGAAGLLAGLAAARAGARTVVFERNAQPGRKVAMAGGGRCNFTNTLTPRAFIRAFGDPNAAKLGHALRTFPARQLIELLERHGVRSVLEQGYRLYAASGRGQDVVDALVAELRAAGAQLLLSSTISHIRVTTQAGDSRWVLSGTFAGRPGERSAQTVIACTGGLSYPKTGSTGDGLAWARTLGHATTGTRPGLVGLIVDEDWPKGLTGVSCDDVRVKLRGMPVKPGKVLAEERAGLLFTHFGLSGPAILDLSLVYVRKELDRARLELDFFPELSAATLDRQLTETLRAHPQRSVAKAICGLPERLRGALVGLLGQDGQRGSAQFPRKARRRLVGLLKEVPLTVVGTREIEHGEVTVGGVAWEEIDPKTLESKHVPGLFFAGEVLDLAGRCGGFNLQAAFSTGFLAGRSAAGKS